MDRLRGTMYDAAGMGSLYGIPTEELAPVVTKAGQNWAKQAKIKEVSDLIESGRQQGSRNISANERQAIKRKIGTITDPMHKRSRYGGYTPAEKAGAMEAASYTGSERALHSISGLVPRDKLSMGIAAGQHALLAGATGFASIPLQAVTLGGQFVMGMPPTVWLTLSRRSRWIASSDLWRGAASRRTPCRQRLSA